MYALNLPAFGSGLLALGLYPCQQALWLRAPGCNKSAEGVVGDSSASLGSIVTEAVAEERRVRQEEIQKGVVQLLNGKVAEAVLTTPETDVLTYFRPACNRAWRRFEVNSCSTVCCCSALPTGSQMMPQPGSVIAMTPPRTSHGAS